MPARALAALLAFVGIGFVACASLAGPAYPDVAVVLDWNGSIIYQGSISLTKVSRAFYAEHPDRFNFLVIFSLEELNVVERAGQDLAVYLTVRNDVRGIGFPAGYDRGAEMGSPERLEGVVFMGKLWNYYEQTTGTIRPELSYILAHEIGHRFGAYVRCDSAGIPSTYLLDSRADHWTLAMMTGGSPLGGHDWRDNGDGTFTPVARWTGLYSMLDLYLMGRATAEEVGPIRLLDLRPRPYSVPLDTTIAASIVTKRVQDIIAVEGQRLPGYGQAPSSWQAAFLVVAPSSRETTPEVMAGMEALRSYWPERFSYLTRGRAQMSTDLTP